MTEDQLSAALEVAHAKMKVAGGLQNVARPIQVAIIVSTVQGIIDNGGLQYLYESDFEDQLPYSAFVDAYREAGASDAADLLERSYRLFPFESAHLFETERQKWLDDVSEIADHEFNQLSDRLVGHPSVESKLMEYMDQHDWYKS